MTRQKYLAYIFQALSASMEKSISSQNQYPVFVLPCLSFPTSITFSLMYACWGSLYSFHFFLSFIPASNIYTMYDKQTRKQNSTVNALGSATGSLKLKGVEMVNEMLDYDSEFITLTQCRNVNNKSYYKQNPWPLPLLHSSGICQLLAPLQQNGKRANTDHTVLYVQYTSWIYLQDYLFHHPIMHLKFSLVMPKIKFLSC